MTLTYEQLKAQLDDAEETVIALGMMADHHREALETIREQMKKAQNVRLAISAQYIAALDEELKRQQKEVVHG